jgi:hypothetical protein
MLGFWERNTPSYITAARLQPAPAPWLRNAVLPLFRVRPNDRTWYGRLNCIAARVVTVLTLPKTRSHPFGVSVRGFARTLWRARWAYRRHITPPTRRALSLPAFFNHAGISARGPSAPFRGSQRAGTAHINMCPARVNPCAYCCADGATAPSKTPFFGKSRIFVTVFLKGSHFCDCFSQRVAFLRPPGFKI